MLIRRVQIVVVYNKYQAGQNKLLGRCGCWLLAMDNRKPWNFCPFVSGAWAIVYGGHGTCPCAIHHMQHQVLWFVEHNACTASRFNGNKPSYSRFLMIWLNIKLIHRRHGLEQYANILLLIFIFISHTVSQPISRCQYVPIREATFNDPNTHYQYKVLVSYNITPMTTISTYRYLV